MAGEFNDYFPNITGSEEETRIDFLLNNKLLNKTTRESQKLNTLINGFCPPLGKNPDNYDTYRVNGSRTYIDKGSVELATPEALNPYQHLAYIKANSGLLISALIKFTSILSASHHSQITSLYHRRVIDQKENTWGFHDNFSIHQDANYDLLINNQQMPMSRLWEIFLRSRNFITGAMRIDPKTAYFSQKLSVPYDFNRYSYVNSLLRVDCAHGQRLEIRCNDINLQDQASLNRIGGTALLLAASQTPLTRKILDKKLINNFPLDENSLWNEISLNQDIELIPSHTLMLNIDAQRLIIKTILENLESYTNQPMPQVYRQIGEKILQFCDDVESVALGNKDIDILFDKSDWATKLYVIRKSIREKPGKRYLGDSISMYQDMLYDQVSISAQPNQEPTIALGYGHKFAEKTAIIDPKLVAEAFTQPPAKSRAQARVMINKRFPDKISKNSWEAVKVKIGSLEREIKLSKYLYTQQDIDQLIDNINSLR